MNHTRTVLAAAWRTRCLWSSVWFSTCNKGLQQEVRGNQNRIDKQLCHQTWSTVLQPNRCITPGENYIYIYAYACCCTNRTHRITPVIVNTVVNPKHPVCESTSSLFLGKADFSIIQEWPRQCINITFACQTRYIANLNIQVSKTTLAHTGNTHTQSHSHWQSDRLGIDVIRNNAPCLSHTVTETHSTFLCTKAKY